MQKQQTLSVFANKGETHNDHSQEIETDEMPLAPPSEYPQEAIKVQQTDEATHELCIPKDRTVTATFATISGSGRMGPTKGIANPSAILSVTQRLEGTPVILNGGGMNIAGGGGQLIAQLLSSELIDIHTAASDEKSPQSTRLTTKPLYRKHSPVRRGTRGFVLGSYELSVPATYTDAAKASQALSAWSNGTTEYLLPQLRTAAKQNKRLRQSLNNLAPGDTLKTPSYKTPLAVISEQHEAHVRISSVSGKDKLKPVSSLIVDNPRGGNYQFGYQDDTSGTTTTTCYLGRPKSTPPTPNTSFRCHSQFSATDVEINSSPDNRTPEQIVEPDKDIQNSPLPKPCLRKLLSDIDGVGPKTARKAFLQLKTTDAHKLAFNLYGEGTEIHETDIVRAFDGLSSKSTVLNQLKTLAADLDTSQ